VSDGCIVFQNIDAYSDANGSYDYTILFTGNPPLAAAGEQADSNPGGALSVTIPTGHLVPGVPYAVNVVIDTGTPLTIGYYTGVGNCTTASGLPSPPLPSNGVPVSVSNTLLTGYVTSGDTWSGIGTTPIPSLLLFPWSGVTSVWTGGQTYSYSAGSCPVNATGGSPTVYLPVYPLVLTGVSSSATSLTATEASGGTYALALNLVSGTSRTSVPLGEYTLSDDGGTPPNVTPPYVWVTTGGECFDTIVEATPPHPTCSAASLAVTAS
jgi:hypothetical protein